jgi:electron transport complex protein RnfC
MLIGKADGPCSANVHSSIPGTVVKVYETQGADGTVSPAVLIEFGGEFYRTGKPSASTDWERLPRGELLGRIKSCGVVGLGGGRLPTHIKLAPEPGRRIAFLIANGIASEPSLCGDVCLMREKSREIVTGMRICQRILEAGRVVVAISEVNEGEIGPLFREACAGFAREFEIMALPGRYPQGHEDLVKASVLSRALLSNGAGVEVTCVVLNVATLHAVYEAVVLQRPLIEQFVTVAGSAVKRPCVLKVRVGTPVRDLFEECGGLSEQPGKVVVGGPMRGISVPTLDLPVTKGVSGVVAFTREEARPGLELPCIRCGACVEVCPWGLVPTRLNKLIERGDMARAFAEGLASCTECGCCAFACPSRIPLVANLRKGKRLGVAHE